MLSHSQACNVEKEGAASCLCVDGSILVHDPAVDATPPPLAAAYGLQQLLRSHRQSPAGKEEEPSRDKKHTRKEK